MVNPQVLDYVRQQLAAGVSKDTIEKALATQGWNKQDANEVFMAIEGPPVSTKMPAAAPPPVIPVQPSAAPVIIPAPQTVPTAAPVAVSASTKSKVRVIPLTFALIVLIVLSGIGYAYASGKLALIENYVPFLSHAPYDKSMLLSGVIGGLGKITTSTWDVSLHVLTEPRDPGATPLKTASSTQTDTINPMAAYIPADFDATIDVNGAIQKTDTTPNARGAISLNLTSADLSMSIAAEFRKVGDTMYAVVTKIPGVFGDFSAIKNQWVAITPADQKNLAPLAGARADVSQQTNDQYAQGMKDLQTLLALENKDNVLLSSDPKAVNQSGESLYEYDLTLNASEVPVFYKDAMQAFAGEASSSVHFDQKTLDYLNSPDGKNMSDYLAQNLVVSMWVDGQGIPHKFESSLRLVPDSSVQKLANKQVRIIGDLSLAGINEPVVIDAPTSTISFDQAMSIVTGQTLSALQQARVTGRDAKRIADMQQIRLALELYYSDHRNYPTSLSALSPQYLPVLPTDPSDGTPYLYASGGGSAYVLKANLEAANKNLTKSKVSTQSCDGSQNGRYCYTLTQ